MTASPPLAHTDAAKRSPSDDAGGGLWWLGVSPAFQAAYLTYAAAVLFRRASDRGEERSEEREDGRKEERGDDRPEGGDERDRNGHPSPVRRDESA